MFTTVIKIQKAYEICPTREFKQMRILFFFKKNPSSRLIGIHSYSTAVFSWAHPMIAWEISWHFRYMLYMKAIIELGGEWRSIGAIAVWAITLCRHNLKSYKTFLACRGLENSVCPFLAPNWNSPNSSWVWWVWETLLLLFFLLQDTNKYKKLNAYGPHATVAVSSLHMASAHTNTLTPQVAKWSHWKMTLYIYIYIHHF